MLVVDDEPRMAELTAEILRRAGYLVEVARNGTEALERVRETSPDLMLLDYEMPDMEAPEVLDSLQPISPCSSKKAGDGWVLGLLQ